MPGNKNKLYRKLSLWECFQLHYQRCHGSEPPTFRLRKIFVVIPSNWQSFRVSLFRLYLQEKLDSTQDQKVVWLHLRPLKARLIPRMGNPLPLRRILSLWCCVFLQHQQQVQIFKGFTWWNSLNSFEKKPQWMMRKQQFIWHRLTKLFPYLLYWERGMDMIRQVFYWWP